MMKLYCVTNVVTEDVPALFLAKNDIVATRIAETSLANVPTRNEYRLHELGVLKDNSLLEYTLLPVPKELVITFNHLEHLETVEDENA